MSLESRGYVAGSIERTGYCLPPQRIISLQLVLRIWKPVAQRRHFRGAGVALGAGLHCVRALGLALPGDAGTAAAPGVTCSDGAAVLRVPLHPNSLCGDQQSTRESCRVAGALAGLSLIHI